MNIFRIMIVIGLCMICLGIGKYFNKPETVIITKEIPFWEDNKTYDLERAELIANFYNKTILNERDVKNRELIAWQDGFKDGMIKY